jgi:hypothetical protein
MCRGSYVRSLCPGCCRRTRRCSQGDPFLKGPLHTMVDSKARLMLETEFQAQVCMQRPLKTKFSISTRQHSSTFFVFHSLIDVSGPGANSARKEALCTPVLDNRRHLRIHRGLREKASQCTAPYLDIQLIWPLRKSQVNLYNCPHQRGQQLCQLRVYRAV